MRRIVATLAVCLAVVACGPQATNEHPPTALPVTAPPPAPPGTLPITPAATPQPPADSGLSTDALPEGESLVLTASEAIDVYPTPDGAEPTMTLEPTTILGTPTVLLVLEGPVDGWGQVMLPVRPNGSVGWVEVDEDMLSVVDSQVVVDLSERTLSYYDRGDVMLSTAVAVGSVGNPTPVGSFFVTDNVT
ncbi:MAG: L,D-transpeptidase, partial [Acidimicrobiia bacterium]